MTYKAVDKGYHWVMTLAGAEEALKLINQRGAIERADLQAMVDLSPMQIVKVLDSMVELQILSRSRVHQNDAWTYRPGPSWERFYALHKQFRAMQMQLQRNTLQSQLGTTPIRRRPGAMGM